MEDSTFLYFDGKNEWDEKEAIWNEIEKEREDRAAKDKKDNEGDEDDDGGATGPAAYVGSIEDPA